jgi:hypothetical protein
MLSDAGQAACPHSCAVAAGAEAALVDWTGSSAAIGISKAAAIHNRLPAMNSILLIVCPFPEGGSPLANDEHQPCHLAESADLCGFSGRGVRHVCPAPNSFCPLADALAR